MKMTADLAELTQRDYVCATCWGHLVISNDHGQISVDCPDHPGGGYVTKTFAENQRGKSKGEYIEAYCNIGKTLGLTSGKTADELLKDLGF